MLTKFIKKSTALLVLSLFASVVSAQGESSLVAGKYGEVEGQNVQKVLSAGKVADVLLIALVPEKLLGVSSELPKKGMPYFSEQVQKLAVTGRLAGRGSTAPLEKLVALKPDIIVDVGSVSKSYLATAERVNQQTQLPFVLVDGKFSQTAQQIREVANLIGSKEKGEKLAGYAEKVLKLSENSVRNEKQPMTVYFGRGADGLETGLAGSIHSEVLDWVGLKNVADVAGEKKIARVSMEQLLQWQPSIILTHDKNFYEVLKTSAVWQQLSAVKNNQFYLVPAEPFGWLDQPPSVNRLLGAVWLAHHFATEKVDAKQYAQLINEYFALFYGHQLDQKAQAKFGIK
ncbi:iron ABC transporter substrate-binding protein [Bisgaard Taxon 45]